MTELADLIRLDHRRQLLEREVRGGVAFQLIEGHRGVVASYDLASRVLVKRVDPGRHAYRARPGIAWNLEALAIADRWRPRPSALVVALGRAGTAPTRRLTWAAARQYALRADAGDPRYLVTDDVDRQVLIPWAAWEGEEAEPPPLVETPSLF